MTLDGPLPATTTLVILTSDPEVARGLKAKMKDSYSIKATHWDKEEMTQLFQRTLHQRKRTMTDSQGLNVLSFFSNRSLPLYAVLAGRLVATWNASTDIVLEDIPDSVEGMISLLFEMLEKALTKDGFSATMAYLTSSYAGVSVSEMNDLLSVNDSVLLGIYSDQGDPPINRAPSVLWEAISFYLREFMHSFTSREFTTCSWASRSFRSCAKKRYLTTGPGTAIVHREISDYFQGRWAGKKKPYPSPVEEIELLQDRFIMPQAERYGKFLNVRKFMCLPYHLIHSRNKSSYTLETCFFNLPWIEDKLCATSVLHLICDLEQAKSMDPSSSPILSSMQRDIGRCSKTLSVSGGEIYKCLTLTVAEKGNSGSKKTKSCDHSVLLKTLHAPPRPLLHVLPEEEVSQESLVNPHMPLPEITAMVPVSPSGNHVAVLLRSEGEIKVLNSSTNETERTLLGLDHPQALQMVEGSKALVLCNRELVILDLDEGRFVTKLRGVLNLRLPLFGLQSQQRVVTLSRDRMVVNILDITTGGVVTTFKAGETRFLDSLIISEDGRTLVCGDETQKPFPLLVWSLEHYSLLHDIRLPQHEFLTQLSAISHDGQYLACGCREVGDSKSNFVVVYDLQ
ncbi:uncharacterized protein LOC118478016, partial [Aplysia californica]|uniref:Uncharacterized protein LOC118478016 n=1 Tax=Aplysia californica TaxID=6500 RepID=A0ABM1VWH0_APLCA